MATPTPNLPNIQSYEEILSDMLSSFASASSLNDFNSNSVLVSFFSTVALATARAAGDVFQILDDNSVDRATGNALKLLAAEYGVVPVSATATTGAVNVIDTSFEKIFTKIYAGTLPPNIGSININVSDASDFPAAGAVYIGRGTPNIEGPLPYTTPPVQVSSYWTITLSAPTTKYHNLGETVILAQGGNRTIPANTIVLSPGVGSSASILFNVVTQGIILDGETEVDGVPIIAQTPGASGNVPAGAIKSFSSPPFTGATVTNPISLTSGSDSATDAQIRVQIKNALASIGLGTATAVQAALIGAVAPDENATIVSDSLITNTDGSATVFIDNGTGYEEKSAGVGLESIVDSALGGEQFFQLQTGGTQAPVAKAFLQTTLPAPFDLIGGDTLAVVVGGITYQHVFANSDFVTPGSATAFEVTASINFDTTLGFAGTTAGDGTYVVITGIAEGHDTIFVTTPTTSGRNAATLLGFSSNTVETLRLYKNNIPLSEDGNTASVFTQDQELWSSSIANGDTLILSADGTAPITYSILNTDFVNTQLYTSVAATNSLASWVQVFNAKLTGVTASIVGQQIEITSNLGANNRASVVIDPSSTLVTKGMFASSLGLSSTGAASDYTLDRNTAQFQLVVPLVAGDKLSAGSNDTEASISSTLITGGSLTLTDTGHIWLLMDTPGQIIPTGVLSSTLLTVSTPSTNVIRYTSSNESNAFANVEIGDYVIVWSTELPSTDRLEGRAYAVGFNTLDILITPQEWAAVTSVTGVTYNQGFVVLRSSYAPQRFEVPAGTNTLDQLVQLLQDQTNNVNFSVFNEQFIVATTTTMDLTGSLLVVTSDAEGQLLQLTAGTSGTSEQSLIAFYDSQDFTGDLPLFIHSTFAAGTAANPPDSFVTSVMTTVDLDPTDPNNLICILNPYGISPSFSTTGTIVTGSNQLTSLSSTTGISEGYGIVGQGIPLNTIVVSIVGSTVTMSNEATNNATITVSFNNPSGDAQPYGEILQEVLITGSTVNVTGVGSNPSTGDVVPNPYIHRLRSVDRFYVGSPLNFGYQDTSIVVLDDNIENETFEIPFYRRSIVNTTFAPTVYSYNAYDVDSGATAQFYTNFGDFDFSNFKVLMNAKNVLTSAMTPANTAILYTATQPGASGEQVNVSYVYPAAANAPISSSVVVNSEVSIMISLASGTPSPNSIDSSTTWNVTITPNTPTAGIDQVTYSWSGVGTNPGLSLSGGEYVNITTQSGFNTANTGIFRVSTAPGFAPTATSFTVQRANGTAVAESNALTLVNGAITIYNTSPTTAAQIVAYVNANLSMYVTAALYGSPNNGSGVISLSTAEDSGFTINNVELADGINWIASSNLTGSPQFTLKLPMSAPPIGGQEIRLIPTTMDQVRRFISVLAVSGFTTEGTVSVVDRATRLQWATDTLGSLGAIQVLGGTANEYSVPVLDSSLSIDNVYMETSANNVSSQGMTSGQWFRLQAAVAQAKLTDFSAGTSVTVAGNTPTTGEATVTLSGRTLTDRYFGQPRGFVRTQGDTFKVEKQGSLVCISWNPGVGSNPNFSGSLNFNDSGGGTLNVALVTGTSDAQYQILSGNANFTQLSIGDLITVSGLPGGASNPNNGTFLVTGVSDDGTTIQVSNPNAVNELSSGTFTFSGNANGGDIFTIGSTNLTAGTYASFTGTIAGTSTSVTITANNLGTAGNITLTFSGSTTISAAIAAWNLSNPANMITLTTGNGAQTPSSTTTALTGGVNGNFAVGATETDTENNLASAISALALYAASVSGNVVTVTATPLAPPSVALSYTPISTTEVVASGPFLVGDSFVSGDFTATSGVSEGDTVILTAPFSILNQGRFRVIREYNNSIWIENPNVIEEEVNLPYNPVSSFTFDNSTVFSVDASNNTLVLEWTGSGTQPFLGGVQAGDIVTLGSSFASGNQGSFMVIDSSAALPQVTQITLPPGSAFPSTGTGAYFKMFSAGNATSYYVWYNVTGGSNTDPSLGGYTGIEVTISAADTAATIASETATAIIGDAGSDFTAIALNNTVTITTSGSIETNPTINVSMPVPFAILTLQSGTRTFLEAINPNATTQASVTATGSTLQVHRPQMQFWEYEATVPGDLFTVTGSILTTPNAGSFPVVQVLNRNTAIVSGLLNSVLNVSLNNNTSAVSIREGIPYTGYKHVFLVSAQPGSPNQNLIIFDTNAQWQKVDQQAGVEMTSLGKLNFNTALLNGLDSYRYNTGLIAEANRIIYGDPRDPVTYPGVGAAGADIFVRAPLVLRIIVSIDIRVLTGAPFNYIAQQVATNVEYLVNSNPVGQSIAISAIVSTVSSIPGVSSVAISSPMYDATNDLITVAPNQKAIIIDPSTDISVSQIGS